jgi:O-antigen/teichoic acid export membrane protein
VILARLLSPQDFGLVGMAFFLLTAIETFSQTGFEVALIQRKERTETYLDVAWTIGIVRGAAVFALLLFLAPAASAFFHSPGASPLMRALGSALLIRSFANIGTVYFQKELEFSKQFVFHFSGRIADFAAALVAVAFIRNAWVLVIAFLSGELTRLVVSYLIHPYRPRLSLDRRKAADLFHFGKWILGHSVIQFLLGQGDRAFIGRIIGATMLGFYQIAYRMSNLPASEIAHVISRVTVPAFSKLQDSVDRLRSGYLSVLQVTAFFSIPLGGAILVLAPDITGVFLGEKWLPAVGAMQLLAVVGATRSLISTNEPVFVAMGRPYLMTRLGLLQLAVLAIVVYPLTRYWGIMGTAAALTLAGLVSIWFYFSRAGRLTRCPAADQLKMALLPVGGTLAAGSAVLVLRHYLPSLNMTIPGLIVYVLLFIAVYAGTVALLGSRLDYGLLHLLGRVLSGLRTRP